MTIEERLKTAQDKIQELSQQFNQLEAQKQEVLKEVLRYEGEIRILTQLAREDLENKVD